ncbi:exo-alpha-sialidase [Paenibacillus mesophilus]|uniref:sialidase family protein n=1 Tax=Paenibacillus mesophilus TaxID=2582849 RepID=UPI00110D3945|nr:sialidase family protein [Paenibacillus mesophilus]TMV49422.1 exo-alpha-sialidase [Paenibacillus mesophilus]
MFKVTPLANEYLTIFESPEPASTFVGSPGITRLASGRIVVTMDLGNRWADWTYTKPKDLSKMGKVFVSDDHGKTFVLRKEYPFFHARPFAAGNSLYVLGHCRDLIVMRSDDDGETWSDAYPLTEGQKWHQAPSNVHYANGNVYLVMERMAYTDFKGWGVGSLAPVLMRGSEAADLTRRDNWTFASEIAFRDVIDGGELDYFGVPFFATPPNGSALVAPKRKAESAGWLETNVVQFVNPDHYWHDPDGRTFHLWMRANTGGTGYAAIAKVVEQPDGSMVTQLETVPSGKRVAFVPCPGGQLKFHILYDEVSRLYWLLSSQARDSMIRAELMPDDRYGLPNNERDRLQLHFSTNCIDWCFAGLVCAGRFAKESRQYGSMAIDGNDLHIVSRSGGEHSVTAHDAYKLTFHTIRNFRDLAY